MDNTRICHSWYFLYYFLVVVTSHFHQYHLISIDSNLKSTSECILLFFWERNATYFEVQQGFPTPGNPRYVGNPDQREASLAKCLLVRFLFRYLINPALGLHLQDWDAHSIGAKKLKMFIGEFVHDTQQVFPTPGNPRYAESLGQKEASLAEQGAYETRTTTATRTSFKNISSRYSYHNEAISCRFALKMCSNCQGIKLVWVG